MTITRFANTTQFLVTALALTSTCVGRTFAQDASNTGTAEQSEDTDQSRKSAGELIRAVRKATGRFRDVHAAEAEGYTLTFGCVTGRDSGAMGLHYVNFPLVGAGLLDAAHPQIILYEPGADGHLRLTGADYLVIASQWDAKHKSHRN